MAQKMILFFSFHWLKEASPSPSFPWCLYLDIAYSRASEHVLFSPFKHVIYFNLCIISEANTLSQETQMTLESKAFSSQAFSAMAY